MMEEIGAIKLGFLVNRFKINSIKYFLPHLLSGQSHIVEYIADKSLFATPDVALEVTQL